MRTNSNSKMRYGLFPEAEKKQYNYSMNMTFRKTAEGEKEIHEAHDHAAVRQLALQSGLGKDATRFVLRSSDNKLVFAREGHREAKTPSHHDMAAAAWMENKWHKEKTSEGLCYAAGNAYFDEQGFLYAISNKSGDFQLGPATLQFAIEALLKYQMPMRTEIEIRFYESGTRPEKVVKLKMTTILAQAIDDFNAKLSAEGAALTAVDQEFITYLRALHAQLEASGNEGQVIALYTAQLLAQLSGCDAADSAAMKVQWLEKIHHYETKALPLAATPHSTVYRSVVSVIAMAVAFVLVNASNLAVDVAASTWIGRLITSSIALLYGSVTATAATLAADSNASAVEAGLVEAFLGRVRTQPLNERIRTMAAHAEAKFSAVPSLDLAKASDSSTTVGKTEEGETKEDETKEDEPPAI